MRAAIGMGLQMAALVLQVFKIAGLPQRNGVGGLSNCPALCSNVNCSMMNHEDSPTGNVG